MPKRKAKVSRSKVVEPSVDRKWEIESAARTLAEAEKIRLNRPLMRSVKVELQKQAKAITKAANKK